MCPQNAIVRLAIGIGAVHAVRDCWLPAGHAMVPRTEPFTSRVLVPVQTRQVVDLGENDQRLKLTMHFYLNYLIPINNYLRTRFVVAHEKLAAVEAPEAKILPLLHWDFGLLHLYLLGLASTSAPKGTAAAATHSVKSRLKSIGILTFFEIATFFSNPTCQ